MIVILLILLAISIIVNGILYREIKLLKKERELYVQDDQLKDELPK